MKFRAAVFALFGLTDLAAQKMRQRLHPVANA